MENTAAWRTDIARAALRGGFYTDAEYHLEDGVVLKISMKEMRRALEGVPARSNMMVGPFNIDPHQKCVHEIPVRMQIGRSKSL